MKKKNPPEVEKKLCELAAELNSLCQANGIACSIIFESEIDPLGIQFKASGGIPDGRHESAWPFPVALASIAVRFPQIQDFLIEGCVKAGIWPGPPQCAPPNSIPEGGRG